VPAVVTVTPECRDPDPPRGAVDQDRRIADAVVTRLGIVAGVERHAHGLPAPSTVGASRQADVDVGRQVAPATPSNVVGGDQAPGRRRGQRRDPVHGRTVVATTAQGQPQPL
jgi:hypothetical protein